MCIVSMIHDRYDRVWPRPYNPVDMPYPFDPKERRELEELIEKNRRVSLNTQKSAIELFQEIVKLTKQLDTMLGLPDCEDPKKMEWLENIKKTIVEAESKKVAEQLEFKF